MPLRYTSTSCPRWWPESTPTDTPEFRAACTLTQCDERIRTCPLRGIEHPNDLAVGDRNDADFVERLHGREPQRSVLRKVERQRRARQRHRRDLLSRPHIGEPDRLARLKVVDQLLFVRRQPDPPGA